MTISLIVTLLLVFINGFFVAAEFAIVKVRSSQIDLRARKGSQAAAMAKHITRNLDGYLAATQLGVTLASLALGWIGEKVGSEIIELALSWLHLSMSATAVHSTALVIAFLLITIMHIVFGELAPKSIAIQKPVVTTLFISLPLQLFYILFRPFIWALNGLANLVLKSIGVNPASGYEIHSTEELQLILEQGKESGALDSNEHELIQNIFDFKDRIVKNIMVPRTQIAAIDVGTPKGELVNRLIKEGYSRIPVFTETIDNIIGIVHAKDVLPFIASEKEMVLREIVREPYFIPESKKIHDLLNELQQKRIQIAIVLDEFGGTAGMITLEDIMEELVGEIQDEYDEEKPIVEKVSENEFVVNAMAPINDVNEFLPKELPENEGYDSVAGLVNFIFEKIPDIGETMQFNGYVFTILKKTERMVESVKLEFTRSSENLVMEEPS